MNETEKRARELLESEYRRDDSPGARLMAGCLRDGETHGFEVELRAIVAALSATPQVPEGWVLVPVEPTEAMLDEGGVWDTAMDSAPEYEVLRTIWRDMLAAKPEPMA